MHTYFSLHAIYMTSLAVMEKTIPRQSTWLNENEEIWQAWIYCTDCPDACKEENEGFAGDDY